MTTILLINSCQSKQTQKNSMGDFDISKDDNHIIFSFFSINKGSSIYTSNIDGTGIKQLIKSDEYKSYFNPKYSPDGKKIVFLECERGDVNNAIICIAESDGSSIERLTAGNEIITEVIFSDYGNDIIYCKANEYEKYSPLGKKQAHDFDIYSVDILTKEITKLSNLKSYGVYKISEIDSSNILMHMSAGPDGGMFLFTKDTPNDLRRIIPINNPRGDASLYYTPLYSKQYNLMAFIAPYELYTMDMESRKAKLLYDNKGYSHIEYICFYNTQRKILFSKKGETSLNSISLDGTGLKNIPININVARTDL